MSDVFDLAAAVATRVNAGSYTIADSFTATSVSLVEYDTDDINDAVRVQCVPRAREDDRLSRDRNRNVHTTAIAVIKSVSNVAATGRVDDAAVSALVELTEEVSDQMFGHTPTINGRKARWLKTEISPIYDPERLYSNQQFVSIINVTYQLESP